MAATLHSDALQKERAGRDEQLAVVRAHFLSICCTASAKQFALKMAKGESGAVGAGAPSVGASGGSGAAAQERMEAWWNKKSEPWWKHQRLVRRPRDMAVTEDDILQFGYTRGCYKCTLMSTRDSRGKKTCGHSRGCKDRIKDCLKKTEHGRRRVEEAERRFAEESMTAGEFEERKRQERQEYEERRRSERMSLRDLTPASCGIGRWILRVVSADVVYPKGDNELHCVLLSEDSALYCRGVAKRNGIGDEAFQKMVGKFEPRKIFEVSKVSSDEESDEALNSAPPKHVMIQLNRGQ